MVSTALREFTTTAKKNRTNAPVQVQTRSDQVLNNTGGFVFKVGPKDRLERFLIIGTDGGTYYTDERDLTKQNVDFLKSLIATDERLVVDTIVDVSVNGRAYKQSPALFALALVLIEGKDKAYAQEAFNKVVRTSTHLFEIAQYVDSLGGWGRSKRRAFAGWYENKDADSLAYQAVKYRQRNGWTHKDVLRLSHAKPDPAIANFVLGKDHEPMDQLRIIQGFEAMQNVTSVEAVLKTLDFWKDLPWETIPTQFLTDARVWKALFYNNQLNGQALIRNVTRMARIGAFDDMKFAADYASRLTDGEMIARTRLHPINYLNAAVVFEEGQVVRPKGGQTNGWTPYGSTYGRNKNWNTNSTVLAALNDGFHLAFKSVEPAGKRTLLGVDVSSSMATNAVSKLDLSAAQVAGAVALTVAKTEPYHQVMGFAHDFRDLGIAANDSISTAVRKVQDMAFGATDIALPMRWARENRVEVESFVVITDNEVNRRGHVYQELDRYRQATGIPASLAVLGVSATDFTVADPNDGRMMDFVGFDSNAPRVLADFAAGRL
jgi:60 kDa SS-A/Ro ribonucleoprotein